MFKAPYHTQQTVFIDLPRSKVQISLTPSVDHSTHRLSIIQSIKSYSDSKTFEENIIMKSHDDSFFLNMKQLYMYCRAEQAVWECMDENDLKEKNIIYDMYETDTLAKGWGELAEIILKLKGKGWEYIHPNVKK